MSVLTFKVVQSAWKRIVATRAEDIRLAASAFSYPHKIYLKRIAEDEKTITIEFLGFQAASDQPTTASPQIKRFIQGWLKRISSNVQIRPGGPDSMIVVISKTTQFDEAAIQIFKRDPHNNKVQKYYKCIGGKKDGKKSADPKDCIGIPDWNKKMRFNISKRNKYGQASVKKAITRITSVVSKRARKANQRLKKARGF